MAVVALFIFVGMGSKVLFVFSAVLWHEMAHAQMARKLGLIVREIELLPFGGVARIEGFGVVSAKDEMMIAAAGPVASLVLAVLSYLGMLYAGRWMDLWEFYYKTNMMLAVFNLLPGLPLDGGRILRSWLAMHTEYRKATLIVAGISQWLSVCLILFVIYQYIASRTLNLTFVIAAIFLYTVAKSEVKLAGFRTLRLLAQKKAELIARGSMPTVYFTVVEHVLLKDIVNLFKPQQYYVLLVVNEECKVCRTITETEIWEQLPRKGLYVTIGEFI